MFISPKHALDQGWLTCNDPSIDLTVHIQPNAIDIDCARLFGIDMSTNCELTNTTKTMCRQPELTPSIQDTWTMLRGSVCDFMSSFSVDLPAGVACYLITRSTLVRNGIAVTSGLYDSGYQGPVGGVLEVKGTANLAGTFTLGKGTRICQLIFVKSDDTGILYAGGYNADAGQHWTEKPTH